MNPEQLKEFSKKQWHLPFAKKVSTVIEAFTLTEKVIFYFFVGIFFISGLALLWQVNTHFLVVVPDYGGTLSQGVVGSPRFINPLLDLSDADRDLSALIYSGLMKADADGELVPDLAESWTVSGDGLTYTFVIKQDAEFHDGTHVTADDVVVTIQKAQDPSLQSPRKSSWDGVTVKKIDAGTVEFSLTKPYSPFIQNTTIGILPKHIWSKVTDDEFPFSQYNTKPIGSGPYQVTSISYNSSGLPSEYHLTAFKKYALGRPYIDTVIVKAYQNDADMLSAYKNADIDSLYGISADELAQINPPQSSVKLSSLPRVFGVFFNQNIAPVFVYAEVRQALDMATDKQAIVTEVLGGYGQTIGGPVPPQTVGVSTTTTHQVAEAQALLEKKGWAKNTDGIYQKKDGKSTVTLSFSISTGDAPELKAAAQMLQKQWQDLGATVSVKIFEVSDLNQNIIRPRKYDALLFGEIVGRDLDLYPFWHSSERVDPGLNIALYANLKVDKTLESLRATSDKETKQTLLATFNKELSADQPAVFLYSPYFISVVPGKIKNVTVGSLNNASERLNNIYDWYIETNNVWSLFKN